MKRIAAALIVALALTACGGRMDEGNTQEKVRELDPNPPMSASDIDSIVRETRDRDAARGGGAVAPSAANASDTN